MSAHNASNNLTVDDEPCSQIIDALHDDEATARGRILPLLTNEQILNAPAATKYNLVEMLIMSGSVSDPLKLDFWNAIKDVPAWQAGVEFSLEDLVDGSSINSPFPIFRDLWIKFKSQSDMYKAKLLQLSGRDAEHRELIEQERQLFQQQEPDLYEQLS